MRKTPRLRGAPRRRRSSLDHGIDWLGDDRPPEELNRLVEGGHYGWPYFWGDNQDRPMTEPPQTAARNIVGEAIPMVLGYTAHSAPMQLAFYEAEAFAEGALLVGDDPCGVFYRVTRTG